MRYALRGIFSPAARLMTFNCPIHWYAAQSALTRCFYISKFDVD